MTIVAVRKNVIGSVRRAVYSGPWFMRYARCAKGKCVFN